MTETRSPLDDAAIRKLLVPASRAEMFRFVVPMVAIQSQMLQALSLIQEGKTHEAGIILGEVQTRMASLQLQFEAVPGFSNVPKA
jgi:hypothetical protein